MVCIWANWAWAGTGQAHAGPTWSAYGLTVMGWKWASPCGSHVVYMWANWHGLEVGKPMWFPRGLHVG